MTNSFNVFLSYEAEQWILIDKLESELYIFEVEGSVSHDHASGTPEAGDYSPEYTEINIKNVWIYRQKPKLESISIKQPQVVELVHDILLENFDALLAKANINLEYEPDYEPEYR